MPVVLKPEHFNVWVAPKSPGQDVQKIIAYSHMDFISYPLSAKANNARNDYPELLLPLKAGHFCATQTFEADSRADKHW
jgi:putative SOS response-associated peptidase YedK